MTNWLQLIRSEYQESPGLELTARQAQRFWQIDAALCDTLLTALETARFLRRTRAGTYVKA
jgi:hypothetical protein